MTSPPIASLEVWLGPGGVGKTTLAAASAIAGARNGQRVVVLTIDPAQRLADALGIGAGRTSKRRSLGTGAGLYNEPQIVAGPWAGELWAAMLDPMATMVALIEREAEADQAERILANPLFKRVVGSLSGVNEYMAAERVNELCADARFDRVVIDTPPARHAVDFLDSPDRLTNFVDNRFYRAVLARRRGLARPLAAAAQLVVRRTARLVGADLVDDVVAMFADLEGLDRGFRRRARETAALLEGDDCRYVLVTTARSEAIGSATWLERQLSARGLGADTIVVNRLTPFARPPETGGRRVAGPLGANLDQLEALAAIEDRLVGALAAGPAGLVRIEERPTPVVGVADLVEVADQLGD